MITEEHRKERLSVSVIRAISAATGLNMLSHEHDYGVDGTLRQVTSFNGRLCDTGVQIDYQIKCTSHWQEKEGNIIYDLNVGNYNSMVMRNRTTLPLFLFLMLCPHRPENWLSFYQNRIEVRHSCYWARLEGETSDNRSSVRVRIPTSQILTPTALSQILDDAAVRLGMHQ